MSLFREIWAVSAMNLAALPSRAGASLVTVIGVATVIAVMLSLLAVGEGAARGPEQGAGPAGDKSDYPQVRVVPLHGRGLLPAPGFLPAAGPAERGGVLRAGRDLEGGPVPGHRAGPRSAPSRPALSRCPRTYSGRDPCPRTVGAHRRLFYGRPRTGPC